jgi:hypothetical membrane protein
MALQKTQQFHLILWGFFWCICLVAQMLYPVPYNIMNDHVSNQGSILRNPDGHIVWNIGIIITGIFLIPSVLFVYRQFRLKIPSGTRDSSILFVLLVSGLTGCLGFVLVGIFPSEIAILHQIGGVSFFFGAAISVNCHFWLIFRNVSNNWFLKNHFLVTWILGTVMNVFFLLMLTVSWFEPSNFPNFSGDPRWFDFPVWEWLSFVSICLPWMLTPFLLPKQE